MKRKRPRGRPKLRWKDTVRSDLEAWHIRDEWATERERWKSTVRRDLEAWNIMEEWTTDRERGKGLCKNNCYPAQPEEKKGEKLSVIIYTLLR